MTLNEMAYRRGSNDAQMKFAAAMGAPAPGIPAAGSLGAVPPISTTVPGMPAASLKPAAPNQALPTGPVLGTGVPGMPTIAGMGRTQTQGTPISSPAPVSPATSATAKSASVYAPSHPPKPAKIPTQHSTIGTNYTTETVKSAPSSSAAPVGSAAAPAASAAASSGASSPQLGGIVRSTGTAPSAALANETASNIRNQVVGVSGGGK